MNVEKLIFEGNKEAFIKKMSKIDETKFNGLRATYNPTKKGYQIYVEEKDDINN